MVILPENSHFSWTSFLGLGQLALHPAIWAAYNEMLYSQDGPRFRELNARAAQYYEQNCESSRGVHTWFLKLESLYHHIRVDEVTGMEMFRQLADDLAEHEEVEPLHSILADVESYSLYFERDESHSLVADYKRRLANLDQTMNGRDTNPAESHQ